MAKARITTGGATPGAVQTGGDAVERVERIGTIAPIPTDPTPVEQAPTEPVAAPAEPSPVASLLQEEGLLDPAPPQGAPITEPVTPLEEQQRERERVAPLFDRSDVRHIPFNGDIDDAVVEANPYLGAVARADRLQNVFDAAASGPTISALLTGKVPGTDVKRVDALNEGNTEAAFQDLEITASRVLNDPAILDATEQTADGNRVINPAFTRIMGLATEAFMIDSGSVEGVDFEEFVVADEDVDTAQVDTQAVKKAKGNARLGRAIWQEWQREKNVQQGLPSDAYIEATPPTTQQSEFIGAMAKEAYALANPDVVERVQAGNQVAFQLKNPETIRQAQEAGANPFSGQEVAPLNQPSPTAQPIYEGRTYTRPEVTKVGKQAPGKMAVMEEARQNYHEMAKVVDLRRLNLLMNMAVPALKAVTQAPGDRQASVWADMLGVGKAKYDSIVGEKTRLETLAEVYTEKSQTAETNWQQQMFRQKAAEYKKRAAEYDVEAIYRGEIAKALESLHTAARYKDQANYLTYAIQMLTGRMHVQQNKFNPGSDKLIRFVVGHGDKTHIMPGTDTIGTRNFKEVATLHLGLGGKNLQPAERVRVFDAALRDGQLDQYKEMGQDIAAALADTSGAVEALAQADMSAGINVPPAVGGIQELALKPATLEYLKKHGTEAPYIAEFLMDFAQYADGKPFYTGLEVEMDGITHGISTNGMVLGIEAMAERAGAIQIDDRRKLVTSWGEQGDIRQGMKDFLETSGYSIAENQGKGDMSNTFNAILQEAVKDRDNFLKKSPMTLAYGQELQNLRQHVEATVFTGPAAKGILEIAEGAGLNDMDAVIDFLHTALVDSLNHSLDSRILEMGQLLRANNTVAMITNDVITIESPAGFDQYVGAVGGTGEQTTSPLSYVEESGDTRRIPVTHYEQAPSGSALREGPTGLTPGGWGRGRVIPAAVQGYDGNMIARTGSGQSYKRIKDIAKSRGQSGNFQPIFDAFKVSVGMMDVLRAESNKNWIEGMKNKNYFYSIDDWSRNAYRGFEKKLRELPPGTKVDLTGEYRGLGWLLDPKNLSSHLRSTVSREAKDFYDQNPRKDKAGQDLEFHRAVANDIMNDLRKAGIVKFKGPAPTELTPEQAIQAARIIIKHLDLNRRNGKMRSEIERDSKKLFDKIARQKQKPLQVDLG